MPTPVYVRDAQERPLLPTSPAYMRVMLRTGKARPIPHPALQVIQLTQIVSQPASPPVFLVVELRDALAELLLVIERTRQLVVLHRLLLDLELSAALHPELVDTATLLKGVKRGLGRLLPITQVVVHQAATCMVVPPVPPQANNGLSLVEALPALRAHLAGRPALAAVWVGLASATSDDGVRRITVASHVLPQPSPAVGAVVRLGQGSKAFIGLITALQKASCTVQMPVAANNDHLTWQRRTVPLQALQYIWHPTEVAILPLREVARG